MGFVGDLLGFGDDRGSNFRATPADILQPVNLDQTKQAYNQTQGGLSQQQAFINALMGQNGLANQSSVFNQQQNLANQLQGVANGTGPNPALAQLANTTGQNVSNQAALMAGQRGAGANVGLMARQIGQQGAGIQQNAAGQAAALQAQQQLAAMNALQQQQGMMANVAGQQIGQQQQGLNSYNQAAQNQQAQLLAGLGQYNATNVNQQNAMNNVNASLANTTAQGQQGLLGGIMGAAGTAMGLPFNTPPAQAKAHGGMIQDYNCGGMTHYADGGMTSTSNGFVANWLNQNLNQPPENSFSSMGMGNPGASALQKGASQLGAGIKKMAMGMARASDGGKVLGQAKVSGDSLKNDEVPAMLSPGEVVIPRSVIQSDDPVNNAAKFVAAILARNGMQR